MGDLKRKKWFDLHDTWYSGIFKVVKFKPEIQIWKLKMFVFREQRTHNDQIFVCQIMTHTLSLKSVEGTEMDQANFTIFSDCPRLQSTYVEWVDKFYRLKSMYEINRRFRKFSHFIDVPVNNAFITHKQWNHDNMKLKQFRMSSVTCLIGDQQIPKKGRQYIPKLEEISSWK